jgi:hypothetical protein
MSESQRRPHIGTLRETGLHAALKRHLARPGDLMEAPVAGFVADLLRPDAAGDLIVEVQTRGFSPLKRKLPVLLAGHRVHLVHPIAVEKWIVRLDDDGRPLSRRRSPRRGALADLFFELVSVPDLMAHPDLTFEVLLICEEEVRAPAPRSRRRWRRDTRVLDRRLLEVIGSTVFHSPRDFLAFIPEELAQPFTNRALAEALHQSGDLAGKITYCLRRMGVLAEAGLRKRARLYTVAPDLAR